MIKIKVSDNLKIDSKIKGDGVAICEQTVEIILTVLEDLAVKFPEEASDKAMVAKAIADEVLNRL